MKPVEKFIIYIMGVILVTSVGTAIYYGYTKKDNKPKIINKPTSKEEPSISNNELLCPSRDLDCFLNTYLVELSYNKYEDLINPTDDIINSTLYRYLRDIGNQKDLFNYKAGEISVTLEVNQELLDTLTYIMFGKEEHSNYEIKFGGADYEGIFKTDNGYEIRQEPKGGFRYTVEDKNIDKINDNEYNIKLFLKGAAEDGEEEKAESPTFNLKFNDNKKLFYVNHITK